MLQAFFQEVREVDRDNEVNRILGAFQLNPFEQMGLRFDSTQEEVKRQYRKVSLLIHPDKCKHPKATSAFEVLGHANSQLANEDFMREFRHTLNLARGMLCLLVLELLYDCCTGHWPCYYFHNATDLAIFSLHR